MGIGRACAGLTISEEDVGERGALAEGLDLSACPVRCVPGNSKDQDVRGDEAGSGDYEDYSGIREKL